MDNDSRLTSEMSADAPVVVLLSSHVPHTDSHTLYYTRALITHGYQVIIAAPDSGSPPLGITGVQVLTFKECSGLYYDARVSALLLAGFQRIRNALTLCRLMITLGRGDVFIATGVDAWAIAILAARKSGGKVVSDLREIYEDRLLLLPAAFRPLASRLFRWIMRALARRSDQIIHVNTARQSLYSYLGNAGIVVRMMPNLRELSWITRRENGRSGVVAVHAGPLRRAYAGDELVQALDVLQNRQVPIRLIVFGGIKGELRCVSVFKRLVREGTIEVCPDSPFSEIWSAMLDADIGINLILPIDVGHTYPAPRKLYEYLAAGLPVVGSNISTIKDVIARWNCGIDVDPSSPEQIADALKQLADNPEIRQSMALNARKAAEVEFNSDRELEVFLAMMERLVRKQVSTEVCDHA